MEYVLLIVFKELLSMDVLIASGITFIIYLCFNYCLSIKYVLVDKKEMTDFFLTAIIGLMISQIVMYVFVEVISLYYLFSVVIATGIVMIWNFISRYIFLEK